MRNQWFGDNRDLVKWSAVFRLLESGERNLLYVPMLNPDEGKLEDQRLSTGESLAPSVLAFFRDHLRFSEITWPPGTRVDVVGGEMSSRVEYFAEVESRIESLKRDSVRRLLVLLDPDTGIEPASGGNRQHVRKQETVQILQRLTTGDALAIYQHAPRFSNSARDWIGESRTRLAGALSLDPDSVQSISCLEVAGDVALLVVVLDG